jgi:hypothetical protein
MFAIVKPLQIENSMLAYKRPSRSRIILPIFSKSMPPAPPEFMLVTPFTSSFVTSPRIFGLTQINTVAGCGGKLPLKSWG